MSKAELEDLYHTCRWCKYYQGGVCINEAFTACRDTLPVYAVAEDGRLSECIRETLGSISTDKVERESLDISWRSFILAISELMRLSSFLEKRWRSFLMLSM